MRHVFGIIAVTIVTGLLMGGCSGLSSHTEIEALNEAKVTGSPFTKALTEDYKKFVRVKQNNLDYSDARHFARKGLMSAQGKVVMPEPLSNWHLNSDSEKELGAARVELLQTLDAGGRSQAPFEAASAQFSFDCWIEQEEQNWLSAIAPSCKNDFTQAMSNLSTRMRVAQPNSLKLNLPVPPKVIPPKGIDSSRPARAAPEPVVSSDENPDPTAIDAKLDKGMFLVFFDFDKSTLNATGQQVIDAIAEQAKKRSNLNSIKIVGHTDTKGSDKYNQRLSEKRAKAVEDALIAKGIDASILHTSGRGKKELMVETPNNTREPANRRTEIKFE
jgi:OOP family OmpA-OmpF porin